MIETLMVFLFVVFRDVILWVSAFMLAGYLAFYAITLIVDALSPDEMKPDD